MTGFQIFLTVIASIILLIFIILSVPLKVHLAFDDKIHLKIRYLFIKLDILPTDPSKKKPVKKKAEKEPEPPKDEKEPSEKKPSPIVEMIKANGHDGMMLIISNLGKILGIYGGKIFRSVVFDRIDLHISVGTGDSAATAIKYGKICQKVYPVFGFICSNNLVRKYDISVEPDFLANVTEGEFFCDMNICIRKIINSTIGLVVRLIFGVVIKFFTGAKKNKSSENTQQNVKQ